MWKAAWVPVVYHGAADRTSGLYLDATTGYLSRWSRYNERPGNWSARSWWGSAGSTSRWKTGGSRLTG
ncbi:hypothetical protein [Streptomyces sp. NPDC051098]|uniref:hypothetical protein n=1 Tax=Streptomyces sp. NPDC051098 TaxID=3155411 RepID=UPI003421957B